MFAGRRRALRDPVTFTLDGAEVLAERGEPLATALLAADLTIVARSPKLHRPRGPACFRGACDGCLARVDGVPNVMTCLFPAQEGARVESQNVVGARKADLLRVTDWFFPQGIDHHHLMAGVPALGDAMQSFAQKVAGLGRLPAAIQGVSAGGRLEVDVAVIGGGPSGIATASRLSRAGARVALIDDGITPGGALLGAPDRLSELLAAEPLGGAEVLSRHVAAGAFDAPERAGRVSLDLLVASEARATIVGAAAVVFACGAHDGVVAAPGNDLPGVFSARALCRLLAAGLVPDGAIGVIGEGFWANELARLAAAATPGWPPVRVTADALVAFEGRGGLKAISTSAGRSKVVAAGVEVPPSPAFELPAQGGAAIAHGDAGYRVVVDAAGRAAPRCWAVGECTGMGFDLDALREAAARVADDLAATLR